MKRLMTAILLITMLLSLCACVQEEQMVAPVSYYYLRSPLPNGEVIHGSADSVILADIRESAGRENDYDYLLKIYLTGPQDARFQSPFPRNTFLMNFKLEDGTATLVLSDAFARLTGVDLSLACGCLTMTVLDMTGAERVTIYTETAFIDGKDYLTFDRGSFLLFDDTLPEEE